MSCLSRSLLIIYSITIVICNSCERYDGESRRSFKALAKAYKEAHEQKDVNDLLELVYFGSGLSAQMNLKEFRASFECDIEEKIKRISRKRLKREDREREKYATLKPLGLLNIEYVTNDPNILSFSSYCFGKHEGIYYLTSTGPGMIEEGLRALSEGEGPMGKIAGANERAKLALSRWQDQDINPEPILLWAIITQSNNAIALEFYDEDMDVIGFGIEEHYIDANGIKQKLVEEYAVFTHTQWSDVWRLKIVPIHKRDANQRLDKEKWNNYIKGEGIDPNTPMSREYWTETLPPVWVSIPEPNKTDAYVYIYDREGHKSEPVEMMVPEPKD